MNFDDNNPDFFLHDFEKEGRTGGDTDPNRRVVDFGSESPQTPPRQQRRGCRKGWIWFFAILLTVLGVTVYVRYFTPYVTDSRATGYITNVERRGIFFKTFEGEMISEAALTDTTRVYTRDMSFSIPSDSLALRLQNLQGSGRPVRLTFERYYGNLPWRGATNCILVGIEE